MNTLIERCCSQQSSPVSTVKLPSISSPSPIRRHPLGAAPGWANPLSLIPDISFSIPALISRSPHKTWLRWPSGHLGVSRWGRRCHSNNSLRQRYLGHQHWRKQCNPPKKRLQNYLLKKNQVRRHFGKPLPTLTRALVPGFCVKRRSDTA